MRKKPAFGRDFVLMVVGQVISILGSSIFRFALSLYVLDMTGRADLFSAVLAVSAIPGILAAPLGGAIADRLNRRNLMVLFDFSSSAVIFLLFAAMRLFSAPIFLIGVALALLSAIGAMYQPAVQASIPSLVGTEQLTAANGIVNAIGSLSYLLGPVVGGAIYGVVGIERIVAIGGAAFFLSAVMEIFIRIPFKKKDGGAYIWTLLKELKDGFVYVFKKNPTLNSIMWSGAALNLVLSPFLIIGTSFILRFTLNSNDQWYGLGMAVSPASMLIGALLASVFSKKMKLNTLYRPVLFVAALMIPMAVTLTPFMLNFGTQCAFFIFSVFNAAISLLISMVSVFVMTELQKKTPGGMLGKVMAIFTTVCQCVAPLGQLLYGAMINQFSGAVFIPAFIAGALTLLTSIAIKSRLQSAAQ
jgi:MFS family permease